MRRWPALQAGAGLRALDALMDVCGDSGVRTGFKKAAFTAQETVGLADLKLGE